MVCWLKESYGRNVEHLSEKIRKKVEAADAVLIGLGEEFGADLSKLKELPPYRDFLQKIEKQEALQWMTPFVEKIYIRNNQERTLREAYQSLEHLLDGKNYFIVSTCMDDYIYGTNLKEERIVTPCGGFHKLQCEENCSQQVVETNDKTEEMIRECLEGKRMPDEVTRPVCRNCGKALVFNNIRTDCYAEAGYLEQWNHYMKWLQGTVNRKLCVLELGVGLQFPTVIRWPFEKVVFFNQKADFFRIHSQFYQMAEELKGRGCSIKEKPIDFLLNGFV